MILRLGMDSPVSVIKEDIADTINLVIQVARLSDGSRKITEILELSGRVQDEYRTQKLFVADPGGSFVSTGNIPFFFEKHPTARQHFPEGFFDPGFKVKKQAGAKLPDSKP